jgi:LuxR family transcriptional regulator, maltose regulon positive regulatory protein
MIRDGIEDSPTILGLPVIIIATQLLTDKNRDEEGKHRCPAIAHHQTPKALANIIGCGSNLVDQKKMKNPLFQILLTKLNRPHSNENLIIRPDLLHKLNDGLNKRMIFVSAPAGFGKSTLINSWLDQQDCPISWISLDKADNDPSRFFSYFFTALSKIFSEIDFSIEEINSFSEKPSVEGILASLIAPLLKSPSRYILVLDDYHLIKNPIIHETIQFLAQNLARLSSAEDPRKIRGILPVLISRASPPFSLSKWRLQDELVEIRMDHLQFSVDDARTFLQESLGVPISKTQAKVLVLRTEGWIAGIQLAAISFKEQRLADLDRFIQAFGGGNYLVSDYLLHEVISLLPDEVQQFLINTSILDRFSSALCDEVLGIDYSQRMIDILETSNLFIIPLDDQRTWYRYHHLLMSYLTKRRVESKRETFVNYHLRAASWFESNQHLDECIQHYLAVGEVKEAVRIITQNASPILNQGKMNYLAELIAYFPDSAFDQWPWLCIYRGWKDAIMELGEEEYWVAKAEQIITSPDYSSTTEPGELDEMLGNIAAVRALSAAKRGDIQTTFEAAPKALSLLPKATYKVRGLALHSKGLCQYLNGQLAEAQSTFFEARSELIAGGNVSGASESVWMAGEVAFIQGRLHLSEAIFKEPISITEDRKTDCTYACQSRCGLGRIYYEWNQVDYALELLQSGYSGSHNFGISSMISKGIPLADVYLNLKEWEKAETILQELDSVPSKLRIQPMIEAMWTACWIRMLALTSRYRQVQRYIEERDFQDFIHFEVYREPEIFAFLDYYQQVNQFDTILKITDPFLPKLRDGGRNNRLIHGLLFQTAAYLQTGEKVKACESLVQAISLGRLEGFTRSFIDAGDPIIQLLIELTKNERVVEVSKSNVDYIREIIHACLTQNSSAQSHIKPALARTAADENHVMLIDSPLTPPELNVLRLMVAGCDNYEIASFQHISINTVKTHVSHIFGKMGVHNRLQAANRAKILGLV